MRDPAFGDAASELGAIVVRLNVTDAASVESAFADLPALDVLINDAGILGTVGVDDLDTSTLKSWDRAR